MQKKIFLIVLSLLVVGWSVVKATPLYAQDVTPTATPTPQDNSTVIQDLQKQIQDLQNKISNLQGQEKTLASQIDVMDSQIKITELRINATEQQISDLTLDIDTANKKIDGIQSSLDSLTQVLLNRVVATYEVGTIQPVQMLLTSSTVGDFLKRLNYLRIAQAHDKRLMYDTVQAKNDYENQKNIYEYKKKQILALKDQLQQYTKQLDDEKATKQSLLAQTQGDEENYQRILAQTQAQLASFQGFVTSQGGASILTNQTVCDDWGCYYNQRDAQWGNIGINQTSTSIAEAGCLLTSMAMVYTHYGHRDVTPLSIDSNSSNFSGIPPVLLKYSIAANGVSSQRMGTDIDATLASGNPVIIGISYDGGPYPDHFLVLLSGSNGNYMMNDPFTPSGHNISFRGRYPSVRVVEEDKVVL